MRRFKGLENIHSVIDRHVAEWRREQGEPVEENELTLEENVRRRLTKSNDLGSGKFSADRFLGAKPKKKEVEIKSIIKHQDGKTHSWLYNEVVKAINDAKGNEENTKIVAIFIPVIQNSKEFEELPFDSSVTLPPVEEKDVKIEELLDLQEEKSEQETNEDDFNLLPESQDKPDQELAEAFQTMEEKLDENLQEELTEPETIDIVPEEEESDAEKTSGEAMQFTEIETQDNNNYYYDDDDDNGKFETVELEPETSDEPELVPLPEDFDDDVEIYDEGNSDLSAVADVVELSDAAEDEEKIKL